MYRQNRYDACIKEVKSKLKKFPNSLHLLNYQAMAYSALKRDKEALESYQKIIKKDSSLAGPYYNMGIILKRNGRVEEAIDRYNKAISLKPDYVQAYNNLGVLYKDNEKYENAITMFMKAKELQPDHQNSYYNLALIKKEQGLDEEAVELLLKVLEINPEHNRAKYRISVTKFDNGLLEESKKYLQEILISDEKHEGAAKYLAFIALKQVRFQEVWKYYEYRWKVSPGKDVIWPFEDKPLWKGEKGSRVALWREQGIGDDIIFLSLAPEVKKMCETLSVYVDPRLHSLCKRTMPEINFFNDIEELQNVECEYHLPMGSVPGLIRNDISDFDRTVTGYLKADPQRVEAIRNELGLDGKAVIGVSWKSLSSTFRTKSIHLRDMERIFTGLDVVLVNLQYGDVDEEIKEFKEATGINILQCTSVDNREDLDGLAALIEVCDLVVSTTNVTVHMSGALAKETWVLLPYVANFWWLLERTDSVWYPSSTLYRQPALDDWDSVYASIRIDLETRLGCN